MHGFQTYAGQSPYLLDAPPESSARVFLARAFAHYCALQWGHSDRDIAAVFDGTADPPASARIEGACRLLGGLLTRGIVRGWARPFGGGEPVPMRPSAWELDDFRPRFASSAIDMSRPFDFGAEPTHWIFVDLDDWNAVLEASIEPMVHASRDTAPGSSPVVNGSGASAPGGSSLTVHAPDTERLLRLPEVLRRTGLSRQTIYRRMGRGEFPKNQSLGGSISVWRESDIAAWVASPR